MNKGLKERIIDLINSVAQDQGYDIYDASVYLKGQNSRVIVKIDHAEGISHGDCDAFSRSLARKLDDNNILPNYSLEISSPGIKRKLRTVEEFKRFQGSLVKIVYDIEDKRQVIKGKIASVTDMQIFLESDKGEIAVNFNTIKNANLEY